MKNQEKIRQLTKAEISLLDKYNLSCAQKNVIESFWEGLKKPVIEKTNFSSGIMAFVFMLLMSLFPVILLIQFINPELMLSQAKLWESLFNVTRFVFWAALVITVSISLLISVHVTSIKDKQNDARENGSTDEDELKRRNNVFTPTILTAFSRKKLVWRFWKGFNRLFIMTVFVMTAHYWSFVLFAIGLLVIFSADTASKTLVEQEFELIQNPPKKKSITTES